MHKIAVIPAAKMLEGAGFEVKRPVPNANFSAIGPFLMLDHIGPTYLAPKKAVGAPTHPHVGIETFTYFIKGEGMHHDSLGNKAITRSGEAQWMRAGSGIVHDEGPTEKLLNEGGHSHMVQLWINMPGKSKDAKPDYRSFKADDFVTIDTEGALLKVIAGKINGTAGPLETFALPTLSFIELNSPREINLTLAPELELGIYVLTGSIMLSGQKIEATTLARLPDGTEEIEMFTDNQAEVILLGGPTIKDQLVRYGPFVTNSEQQMQQAIQDYQQGKFGIINK